MLFTSYEFLGFLIILFIAYYLVPKKAQWPLLLGASYLFYFFAGPTYLIYIAATTLTVYIAARGVGNNLTAQDRYLKEQGKKLDRAAKKSYRLRQKKIRFRISLFCVLFNLGILAVLKYGNFFITNANGILSAFGSEKKLSFLTLALPMGISFYTFQAIGYLIDVYRGTVRAEKNPFKLALFISFFPQLIQGPISRFGDLSQTLFSEHKFDSRTVLSGFQRVLWGYFKKTVIADRLLIGVSTVIGDAGKYRGAYVVAGMILYTAQLYADFTGGIDITIGISEAMGIKLKENFNLPFFSPSLKEYWRRWHISMGTWFRDYVFYPVSVSKLMQKFSGFSRRHFGMAVGKRLPVYLSSFTVWLATGIWHGANWNFVIWGLLNWLILMVSEELTPLYGKFHAKFRFAGTGIYRAFMAVRTVLLISFLHIFDCYASPGTAFSLIGSVFTAGNWKIFADGSLMKIGLSAADYVIVAAGVLIMLAVSLTQRKGSVRERLAEKPYAVRFAALFALFLAIIIFGAYGINYDASQFIYNRF